MPHLSTNSNSVAEFTRGDAPEKLIDALRKYQSDSDLDDLRRAYDRYLSRQKKRGKLGGTFKAMKHGALSFTITPSRSCKKYRKSLKKASDVEAIKSDWEMVGEDLSFAVVKYIVGEKK